MELTTIERFLLITHHPEKGRFVIPPMHVSYGIIGAVLLDLSLKKQLVIEDGRLVINYNKEEHNDPIITDVLNLILLSKKVRKINYWITKLSARSRKYKWIGLEQLEEKKFLRIENKKFLGLFPYRDCYLVEKELRLELIKDLKEKILYRQKLSEEDISILGLVEACKIYRVFTRDRVELKELKKRMKELKKENEIADTVSKTVMEVQSAIISGILAATIVTTTTT